MYDVFFRNRLAKLRISKNVSAREMSLSIGQSRNYINGIENGKSFPTMQMFFYICEYLNISPREFFDDGNTNPEKLNDLMDDLKKLDSQSLEHISGLIKSVIKK